MGIIDKLTAMKDAILEGAEEAKILSDMNADEIAKRYGYKNLLAFTRFSIVYTRRNDQEVTEAKENEEEQANNYTLLKIKRDKNGNIIICHEKFGEKETYDLRVLKTMLKKDNVEATIEEIDEEEYLRLELMPEKATLEDKLEEMYDKREEYLGAIIEKADAAKNAAKKHTKNFLNIAADWANKNL